MIEPIPTDEILERFPEQEDLFHKPDFLLVKAKKRHKLNFEISEGKAFV